MKNKYQFLEVADKKLHIKQLFSDDPKANQRPTIVFLHEGLGCIALWKDFPERVVAATGCHVLIYERQGYGLSDTLDLPRPDNYLEIEATKYLPKLLEQLDIKKPIIIGHSDGGTIAIQYAAQYPTTAIISLAGHIYVEDKTVAGIEEARARSEQIIPKLKKYHGDKTETIFWAWPDTWLQPSYKLWNVANILPAISCPALILQGKQDEFATDQQALDIAEGIRTETACVFLDNCGHVPHVQAKEVTLKHCIDFVLEQLKQIAHQTKLEATK